MFTKFFSRGSAVYLGALGALGWGLAATMGLALQPTATAQAQQADDNLLEEILVTARRREESLQDVPVAITVLSTDFVQEANILDTFDLYAETPGVDYEQTRERLGGRTIIRGVVPGTQNPLEQKASIFVDGAPVFSTTASMQFIDLERVEVLRGPQSAAFGRATFAGAINYVTRDPGDEFNATVRATASSQNRAILGASVDGPITDTLGFTLDVFQEDFDAPDEWITTDGYRAGSTSTDYFSGKLKFTPNDFFDMEILATYTEADDGPGNEYLIASDTIESCNNHVFSNGRTYVRGLWKCEQFKGPNPRNHDLRYEYTEGTRDYNLAWAESVLRPGATQERERIAGEFNFSFDNGGLLQLIISDSSNTSRRWIDSDMSDASTVNRGMFSSRLTANMGNRRGTDYEDYYDVRWVSPADSSLRWLVGASRFAFAYSDAAINQFAGVEFPELGLDCLINDCMPFQPDRRQNAETEATGIYGNVAYDLSDRTTLSFEARFQRDERLTLDTVSGNTVNQVTESFQPRLAINHTLNDDWSLYGQLAQGTNPATTTPEMINPTIQASSQAAFDAGVITYTAATFASSDEESLTNIEFGVKGNTLDGRLQLTAAVYAIDWTDMLLTHTFDWLGNPPVNGSCAGIANCWNDGSYSNGVIYSEDDVHVTGVRVNQGEGNLKGIEFEANWRATDNWSLRGTAVLQDNKYGKNCDVEPVEDFGFEPTDTVRGADCYEVAGNTIERNSESTGTFSVAYARSLGGNWSWTGRLGVRHQSAKFYDVINYLKLPAATTMTGQVTFNNDNLDIILFGNNLTEEDTPLDIDDYRDNRVGRAWSWRYRPRLPREVGLRLNYSF